MIAEELLKKIEESMFEDLDIDELLDARDCEPFDSAWVKASDEVENWKTKMVYTQDMKKHSDQIRQKAYRKVYQLSGDSDLSAYISDDFGLIADSEQVGYQSPWLDRLTACYRSSKIPSGAL